MSAQAALGPILAEQQVARQRMLLGDTPHSRKSFRSAQHAVTKAVHKAKEDWIENVAKKAEAAGRDGAYGGNASDSFERCTAGANRTWHLYCAMQTVTS